MFDFQDKRGLLTLGWIHTHPTQRCGRAARALAPHLPRTTLLTTGNLSSRQLLHVVARSAHALGLPDHAARSHRDRLRAAVVTRVRLASCARRPQSRVLTLPSPPPPSSLGIFRLTDPPGLQLIMSCTRHETFHPHPDVKGGIYTVRFPAPAFALRLLARRLTEADARVDGGRLASCRAGSGRETRGSDTCACARARASRLSTCASRRSSRARGARGGPAL